MKQPKTERLLIALSQDERAMLQSLADANQVSMSQLIRQLIRDAYRNWPPLNGGDQEFLCI